MGQSGFSKMTELSLNATELSVNLANFVFSEDYCSFHMSNVIRLNFSEFHQIFPNFMKIDMIDYIRIFCST
jgi:hypothetical protein